MSLSAKQTRAISNLLTCKTNREAAERTGISYRQMSRWLANPEFRAALYKAEGEVLGEATRRLATLLSKGVDELESVLANDGLTTSDRLSAIRTLFNVYPSLKNLSDIDRRLTELEEILRNE